MAIKQRENNEIIAIAMVKNLFFCLILLTIVLIVGLCYVGHRNSIIPDTDFVILNKSISSELDTIDYELMNYDSTYKDYIKYLDWFNPKRCIILVQISINNGDTLVDFIQYDTLYKYEVKSVPIVGSYKSPNGTTIQFSDECNLANGVLYKTKQAKRTILVDTFYTLTKPMVLKAGKLSMNPPKMEYDN